MIRLDVAKLATSIWSLPVCSSAGWAVRMFAR
jgi:hypothetical protein